MSIEQQLIFLFSALGAFNGFVLSGYFLLIKQDKRLSDYFLGGLLLALSLRIMKSVFLFFNPELFELFIQIGLSACMMIGPFLYLYVLSMTKETNNLKKTWWWYILPFVLLIVWLSYKYPYYGQPRSWNPFVEYIYKLWLGCILASAYQMRGLFLKIWKRGEKLSNAEVWLLNIFFGVTIIYLAYEVGSYTSYIVGALSFSFVFYISGLLWVFQRGRKSIASDQPIKYAKSTLSPEDAEVNMQRLSQIMKTDKLYLDPELTLSKLSKQVGINSKELSQSINQKTDYNYSRYIAHLRVEAAKQLLASAEHQQYTIAAISLESGFNSLSTFNTTFKRLTGQTPKDFRKKQV